jgi:hypothetical protein
LKESPKIIIEEKECVSMPNHTNSLEQIDRILQQSPHMSGDPISCCVEDLFTSKLHPLVEDKYENECVRQSKGIDNNEENEGGF